MGNSPSLEETLKKANELESKKRDLAELDIDINDPDALRALAKGKLVEILQTAPVNVSLVAAIRELLDRLDGKPTQSVQMDATLKQITVNATIRFVGNTQPLGYGGINGGTLPMSVIDNDDKSNS